MRDYLSIPRNPLPGAQAVDMKYINSSQHRARARSPHCDRYQDAAAASQMLDIINDDYNVTVMLLTRYVSFHERNNAQTSNLAPGG